MTGKDNRIEKLIAATSLRIHPQKFSLISCPLSYSTLVKQRISDIDNPFWSVTISEEEISLILPSNTWQIHNSYFPKAKAEDDYRVITLDVATGWTVSGYLAKILSILTQENITIGIISAFSRHHLIIRSKDLLQTIDTLNKNIEIAQ